MDLGSLTPEQARVLVERLSGRPWQGVRDGIVGTQPETVQVSTELLQRIEKHLEQYCDSLDGPMGPPPSEILATRILADLRLDVFVQNGIEY